MKALSFTFELAVRIALFTSLLVMAMRASRSERARARLAARQARRAIPRV